MHGLQEIIRMNREVQKVEDNHSRECSFSGEAKTGVVLHSARLRNTCWLPPSKAKKFLARWWSVNSVEARNHLVESYF